MTISKLLKGLALTSSASLVVLFLFYRVETFDKYLSTGSSSWQSSHNGAAIRSNSADTTKPVKDSSRSLFFSSSKVLILTDKKSTLPDSFNKRPAKDIIQGKKTQLWSSSKSVILFKPGQTVTYNLDSFRLGHDTAKNKTKKTL